MRFLNPPFDDLVDTPPDGGDAEDGWTQINGVWQRKLPLSRPT